jgi:hypothetical protein
MFHTHKKICILSHFVQKCVFIPVSENFSFAKIIHPPDRCGISRSWLNSVIITQVQLVLGAIKDHTKMCSFVTQIQCHRFLEFWGSVQSCCQRIHFKSNCISHMRWIQRVWTLRALNQQCSFKKIKLIWNVSLFGDWQCFLHLACS